MDMPSKMNVFFCTEAGFWTDTDQKKDLIHQTGFF